MLDNTLAAEYEAGFVAPGIGTKGPEGLEEDVQLYVIPTSAVKPEAVRMTGLPVHILVEDAVIVPPLAGVPVQPAGVPLNSYAPTSGAVPVPAGRLAPV